MGSVGRKRTVIKTTRSLESNKRKVKVTVYTRVRTAVFIGIRKTGIVTAKGAVRIVNVEEVVVSEPAFENDFKAIVLTLRLSVWTFISKLFKELSVETLSRITCYVDLRT
jgi:hypothetical protein